MESKNKNVIVATVAEALGLSVKEVTTDCRKGGQLYARYIAIQILKEEGFSLTDISETFTHYVMHSIKHHCATVFDELVSYNQKFKNMYLLAVKAVEELENEIENNQKSA